MRKKIFFLILILVGSFWMTERAYAVLLPMEKDEIEPRVYVLTENKAFKFLLGVTHEFPGFFSTKHSLSVKALEKIGLIKTETVGRCYALEAPARIREACECPKIGEPTPTPTSPPQPPTPTPIPPGERSCYPSDQHPWGIEMVGGGSGGGGRVVAVLDTGIKSDHLDLHRRFIGCKNFTDEPSCEDGMGHGTHVSGTVAADSGIDGLGIYGVAPEAKILMGKVLNSQGSGSYDDVAAGIRWAADNGANIINMSLGGPTDVGLLSAIDYAVNKGVLVVAAAGNNGNYYPVGYPAAYHKVVAVGAIDSNKQPGSFSNCGTNDGDNVVEEGEIELAAPGVYPIESTFNNGCYKLWGGTSMASPHVAGLAAKLWQGSASSTRSYLQSNAEDINEPGVDKCTGFGLPRAY